MQIDELLKRLQSAPLDDIGRSELMVSLLLAFVIGQLVAWVYVVTHSGLSYSRLFSQSLVLLTIIAALVMHVIGNSLIAAFGLIGALAIIRFRNVLKDTRDTAFVFLCLVVGMAIGSQRYLVAIVGATFLLLVSAWLHLTAFGTRARFDGHLTCRVRSESGTESEFLQVLDRFLRSRKAVTVQTGGEDIEYVYEVRLRDRARGQELVETLRRSPGVRDVAFVLQRPHVEL
jgi:uncharacterized membrane protein YhiD involved in acid resistance